MHASGILGRLRSEDSNVLVRSDLKLFLCVHEAGGQMESCVIQQIPVLNLTLIKLPESIILTGSGLQKKVHLYHG